MKERQGPGTRGGAWRLHALRGTSHVFTNPEASLLLLKSQFYFPELCRNNRVEAILCCFVYLFVLTGSHFI